MIPYPHQITVANEAFAILKQYGIVYLAMEERTGKSLSAILTVEKSDKVKTVLVITTNKGLGNNDLTKGKYTGWKGLFAQYKTKQVYTLINYESVHKITGIFDLVILDEPHTVLTKYPKTGVIWKKVAQFTKGKPLIYLDATPSAQSLSQLFNQFALSSYSPWKMFKSFYAWFEQYGIPEHIFVAGRQVAKYHKTKEAKVRKDVEHLFISYTRKELGFEHEPYDELHYIELRPETKSLYNKIMKDRVVTIANTEIVCDTSIKLRVVLHQIEGGTVKEVGDLIFITEKIDYILHTWGDTKDLVIMYEYIEEEKALKRVFFEARILQATSWAAGVDLSMHETIVVYSMNFSTANYTQRRARQCNMERATPITVHYLVVKDAISEQVYNTVATNKTNFVDAYFEQKEL